MPKTLEEITKDIKETEELIRQLKEKKEETIRSKLKRFPECCDEVCVQLNETINHILSNLTKAKSIKEKVIHKDLEYKLKKEIFTLESQYKELNKMRDELYARGTCNCYEK